MGHVEAEELVGVGPAEGREAGGLRVGDRLAFTYDPAEGSPGISMSPVQVRSGKPVTSSPRWVWGQVAGLSKTLWRSFPVVTDRRTVWVLCEFGDQSSIIRGIPYEVMIATRRSAS